MKNPSPTSHISRLVMLLFVFLVIFLGIREALTPTSWNYQISAWYRLNSPKEIAKLPVAFGGNDSCQSCHEEESQTFAENKHASLSCESCHGALADHARERAKVADARVDESSGQCLICHRKLVSRPKDMPQFDRVKVEEHRELDQDMVCLACHDPHDPTP